MEKSRAWWDNEARLKALGKGHNSPFNMNNKRLNEIVKELEGASKMHLKQSKEIKGHIDDMKSPLNKKDTCWKGYVAKGKKKSPSGKKTKSGKAKMVNNCVKIKKK